MAAEQEAPHPGVDLSLRAQSPPCTSLTTSRWCCAAVLLMQRPREESEGRSGEGKRMGAALVGEKGIEVVGGDGRCRGR